MLEDAARRITRSRRTRGLFDDADEADADADALVAPGDDEARALAANAAAGITPPAGPAWKRGALPPLTHERDFDRHLSVGRGGFTLHRRDTCGRDRRAGAGGSPQVCTPPADRTGARGAAAGPSRARRAEEAVLRRDLRDPLSLLTRLCASVPPPRSHTVRYVGVLASASKLRPRILPAPPKEAGGDLDANEEAEPRPRRCRYRPWPS